MTFNEPCGDSRPRGCCRRIKRAAAAAALMENSTRYLFLSSSGLLLAVAGLDAASDVLEHALGSVGELSGVLQFQIFVQGFLGAGSRNHLAGLGIGGRL